MVYVLTESTSESNERFTTETTNGAFVAAWIFDQGHLKEHHPGFVFLGVSISWLNQLHLFRNIIAKLNFAIFVTEGAADYMLPLLARLLHAKEFLDLSIVSNEDFDYWNKVEVFKKSFSNFWSLDVINKELWFNKNEVQRHFRLRNFLLLKESL